MKFLEIKLQSENSQIFEARVKLIQLSNIVEMCFLIMESIGSLSYFEIHV